MFVTPKEVLRKLMRKTGYDVRRISVESDSFHQLVTALRRFEIDTVFDVGANIGQFASGLRAAGYTGSMVSFEPLREPYARLVARARRDQLWYVHERLALGDRDGQIEINVAGNSVSSSALGMLPLHAQAAARSPYIASETVALARLDSVATPYLAASKRAFLKVDVQGYEAHVLSGASGALHRFSGIVCELSLVPLYEGQPIWLELLERMKQAGFTLWAVRGGFADPRDGRTLQIDATFFRV